MWRLLFRNDLFFVTSPFSLLKKQRKIQPWIRIIYIYIWQLFVSWKQIPPSSNYGIIFENPCPWRHSRHVCCVTQQTCLLCDTADMSTVWQSSHVCCVTQKTCLLCHTEDTTAVWHSLHVCCVTRQTCLLWDTADCVWVHTCMQEKSGERGRAFW